MSPSAVEIGPASGPDVVLEVKHNGNASPNPDPNKRHEEHQYLDLIRDIMDNGEHRPDRYVTFHLVLPVEDWLT